MAGIDRHGRRKNRAAARFGDVAAVGKHAAGRDALPAAIELAGGTERVITLSDPRAQQLGVRLSAPTPDRAPRAVDEGMALLAAGTLRMKHRRELPLQQAAEAHRLLESGETHDKVVLTAP